MLPDPKEQTRLSTGSANYNKDTPAYTSPLFLSQRSDWALIDDVLGGTKVVRAKRAAYLPKNPGEADENWERRVRRTELFPGLQRTVRGLTGIVLRNPPTLDPDADARLLEHAEDIDGIGTHFEVFARRSFAVGLAKGWAAIFVDFPAIPQPDVVSRAAEEELKLRPYWCQIAPEQFESVRWNFVNGRPVLGQVVWWEALREADGMFGERIIRRWRVLTAMGDGAVRWSVWDPPRSQNGDQNLLAPPTDWTMTEGIVGNQTEIPLAWFYTTEPIEAFHAPPPLIELAYTNLAHFEVRADRRTGLRMAACPILVLKGRPDPEEGVVVGPNATLDVPADGDAFYTEHNGAALGEVRQELQDLLAEMAAQGLTMLQRETRAAETAEAKALDKAEQDSTLATAARGWRDALEQAWKYHASYLKTEAPRVSVNTDYSELGLPVEEIKVLSDMVAKGQLSVETMWAKLMETGFLGDTFDTAEEANRLARGTLGEGDLLDSVSIGPDLPRPLGPESTTPDPAATPDA